MNQVEHIDLGFSDTNEATKGSRLAVEFFEESLLNAAETERQRQISGPLAAEVYVPKTYARITFPNGCDIMVYEVDEKIKKQFPRQWAHYEKTRNNDFGTPLSKIPALGTDVIKSLNSISVFSAEQLAALSDSDAKRGLGFETAREKAKYFLGRSQEVEKDEAAKALESKVSEQDALIKELTRKLSALEASQGGTNGPANSTKRAAADRI